MAVKALPCRARVIRSNLPPGCDSNCPTVRASTRSGGLRGRGCFGPSTNRSKDLWPFSLDTAREKMVCAKRGTQGAHSVAGIPQMERASYSLRGTALVRECESFIMGRYASFLYSRGLDVPAWAWLSELTPRASRTAVSSSGGSTS